VDGKLKKTVGNMKVYSAYKPMALDNESDNVPSTVDKNPSVIEKTATFGRQEKSKVCTDLKYQVFLLLLNVN